MVVECLLFADVCCCCRLLPLLFLTLCSVGGLTCIVFVVFVVFVLSFLIVSLTVSCVVVGVFWFVLELCLSVSMCVCFQVVCVSVCRCVYMFSVCVVCACLSDHRLMFHVSTCASMYVSKTMKCPWSSPDVFYATNSCVNVAHSCTVMHCLFVTVVENWSIDDLCLCWCLHLCVLRFSLVVVGVVCCLLSSLLFVVVVLAFWFCVVLSLPLSLSLCSLLGFVSQCLCVRRCVSSCRVLSCHCRCVVLPLSCVVVSLFCVCVCVVFVVDVFWFVSHVSCVCVVCMSVAKANAFLDSHVLQKGATIGH